MSSDIIEQSLENSSETVQSSSEEHRISSPHENSSYQTDLIQSIDNQQIYLDTNSVVEQLIEIIQQQQQQQENFLENNIDKEQNQLTRDSSENKQQEINLSTIENKSLKRKRRRSQRSFFTLKRRKPKQSKSISNDQIQFWINKYSIEPISILLHRANLPID